MSLQSARFVSNLHSCPNLQYFCHDFRVSGHEGAHIFWKRDNWNLMNFWVAVAGFFATSSSVTWVCAGWLQNGNLHTHVCKFHNFLCWTLPLKFHELAVSDYSKAPNLIYLHKMCSGNIRKPNETMRLLVTTFVGVVFGFFLGVSFPTLSLTKVQDCYPLYWQLFRSFHCFLLDGQLLPLFSLYGTTHGCIFKFLVKSPVGTFSFNWFHIYRGQILGPFNSGAFECLVFFEGKWREFNSNSRI